MFTRCFFGIRKSSRHAASKVLQVLTTRSARLSAQWPKNWHLGRVFSERLCRKTRKLNSTVSSETRYEKNACNFISKPIKRGLLHNDFTLYRTTDCVTCASENAYVYWVHDDNVVVAYDGRLGNTWEKRQTKKPFNLFFICLFSYFIGRLFVCPTGFSRNDDGPTVDPRIQYDAVGVLACTVQLQKKRDQIELRQIDSWRFCRSPVCAHSAESILDLYVCYTVHISYTPRNSKPT